MHDSVEAEKLAKFWHRIGFALYATALVIDLCGMLWHKNAIKEHEDRLRANGAASARGLRCS